MQRNKFGDSANVEKRKKVQIAHISLKLNASKLNVKLKFTLIN